MTNLREEITEIIKKKLSWKRSKTSLELADQILQVFEIKLQDILSKFYACDSPNCGNGAICNYCALRKNIEACLVQKRERIG